MDPRNHLPRILATLSLLLMSSLAGQPVAFADEMADATSEAMADATSEAAEPEAAAAMGDDADSEKPEFAESIEVVETQGTRTDTATVVSREEIETRRASVAYDALDKSPGLHLRSRLGATGAGLSRLVIRGNGAAGPAGLAVFVDGRPDSSVSFAHPAPSAHSLESVEQIEVIHGPSPVLHGAGKTGVVNITTGRPGPGWSGALMLSGGSHATAESFLRAAYGWDGGYLRVGGAYRSTDGHNPASDARVANGNVRLGLTLSERWDLELGAGRTDDHFSVFGPFFVPGPFGNPGTQDIDLIQTTADVKLRGAFANADTSIQLWYDDLDPASQNLRPGVRRGDVSESGLRFKARLFEDRPTSLIVGLDVLQADARNTPGVPPGRPEQDESLTEVGPYVFVDHEVSERLRLRGGARLVDHSDYGTEPVAEAGMVVRLDDGSSASETSSLRLRATRGYQSPTLQQLFGLFRGGRAGLANPELEPEILNQYELGFNRRTERWELDAVAFLQDGSDLIQAVAGKLRNSGEYSHPGFEGRLAVQASSQVRLDFGATFLDLEDGILSVPDTTFDFGLTYRPDALRSRDAVLTLLGRWSDGFADRITPQAPVTQLGSYLVADLKFRLRAWDGGDVFVEVDNLTDEEYQTVAGIPMPGLTGFAGFAVDF